MVSDEPAAAANHPSASDMAAQRLERAQWRISQVFQQEQNLDLLIRNLFQHLHPGLSMEDASILVLLTIIHVPKETIILIMNEAAKLVTSQDRLVVTLVGDHAPSSLAFPGADYPEDDVKAARQTVMTRKLKTE